MPMRDRNKPRTAPLPSEPSAADVAARWIEKWSIPVAEQSGDSDGYDLDWELPSENPRLCLDAILQILTRIPSDPAGTHFQVLAAGPLEDLLVHHGSRMIEEIDLLARRSPSFRLLLNGVWTSRVDPFVVERLAKYRQAKW